MDKIQPNSFDVRSYKSGKWL